MKIILCIFFTLCFTRFAFVMGTAQQTSLPYVELKRPDLSLVIDVAWSPDSQFLAISLNQDVWIFDAGLQEVAHLQGHTGTVNAVEWSPDGTQLASASDDSTIRLWDMRAGSSFGSLITTLTETNRVFDVSWHPDMAKAQLVSVVFERLETFSDGAYLHTRIHVWNTSTRQTDFVLNALVDPAVGIGWSRDGAFMEIAGYHHREGYEFGVYYWDTVDYQLQKVVIGYSHRINAFRQNPVSDLFAVSFASQLVIDHPVTRQAQLARYLQTEATYSLDWHPNGTLLVIGDTDAEVKLLDTATDQMLYVLSGHGDAVHRVDWSPDGRKIASASVNNVVRIWDTNQLIMPAGIPTITPRATVSNPNRFIMTPQATATLMPTPSATPNS